MTANKNPIDIIAYIQSREFIIEVLAVLSGAAYTVLYTYGIIWCWAAALLSSVLFIYLVFRKELIAETVLHIFYFVFAFYGLYTWGNAYPELKLWDWNTHLIIIPIGIGLTALVGYSLNQRSSAQIPYLDSFTTIFSFAATYMMVHNVFDNWWYWLVIDSLSIILYASRKLYLSALLFAAYTIIVIHGIYTQWPY